MKDKEQEEALKKKINCLQEKRAEKECLIDNAWKVEEEDDDNIRRWNEKLDDVMSNMTVRDSEIDKLLEERQDVLQSMKRKRQEFLDAFEDEIKYEQKKIEKETEEIKQELSKDKEN